MAVYKEEKTNTWRAVYRYTDWNCERKQTQKRGFKTKREAQAWEREQLNKSTADLDMTFKSFVDLYTADMKTRLKENTWAAKDHIIRTKLLPYFGKLKMCKITAQQIITWQNEMMNHKDEQGKPYSPVYLKTVHNQLSAIFNHAVRYYNLRENPCKKAGSMGKKKNREMLFWTKEEYLKFAETMMDKPLSFYAFETLYWCGIREGELLALTPADFDFEKGPVSINKSYQRLNGQDLITTPKTEKSNRVITMPQFLTDEIQDYLKMLYGIGLDDRMFAVTKSYLHREMDRGANVAHLSTQIIDWIRIDDLPNQPLDIEEIRTQPANEIEGTFFEVKEGDILVARLGPTILNQKIVMVRSLERTTIASAEFLVLRCKKGYGLKGLNPGRKCPSRKNPWAATEGKHRQHE